MVSVREARRARSNTASISPSSADTEYSEEGTPSSSLCSASVEPLTATRANEAALGSVVDSGMPPPGARVGRYVVLERVGEGGMGVVFAAYDDMLDRRVAIKLVHERRDDEAWQTRIMREAQALARLSHPNVVQIHEVGEYAGRVFLVMEFVKGDTFKQRLCEHVADDVSLTHSTPDLKSTLDLFVQAGRGLAAAHAAGLVHRDFKPANVLVGDDDRPRVVDFGLVASAGSALEGTEKLDGETLHSRSDAPLALDLTATGAVMGTLAYMSPEQLCGLPATPRSDQFSYCVALYEALHGARPFAGRTYKALRRNVNTNLRVPVSENRAIPQHVRAAIERGLKIEPRDRWPSMEELLEQLSRDPSQRRRRIFSVTSVLALAGVGLLTRHVLERRAHARCDARGEAARDVWDSARAEIKSVFLGTGDPIAEDTWSRIDESLTTWADDWAGARARACLGARAGEELAARKEICLDRQATQYRGLLHALEQGERDTVVRAVRATAQLPRVRQCESASWLVLGTMLDEDGARGFTRDDTRTQLARARGFLYTGQYPNGLRLVERILEEDTSALGEAVSAEALLLRAQLLRKEGSIERAGEDARSAFYVAGRVGHDRVATEAAVTLLAISGTDLGNAEDAARWRPIAQMLLSRLGLEREALAGTFHLSAGAAYRRVGAYADAATHYQQAREIFAAALGAQDPALAQIENNLGSLRAEQGDKQGALEHLTRGLGLTSMALGSSHPDVAVYLGNIGTIYSMMGDYEKAIEYSRRALKIEERIYGSDHPQVGISIHTLSVAFDMLERTEEARAGYERAARIFEAHFGQQHEYYAHATLGMANIAWTDGEHEVAIAGYERVVKTHAGLDGIGAEDRASALFVLAQALDKMNRDHARARSLAMQALELYRTLGEYTPPQAEEITRWLAERPRSSSRFNGGATE